jgi:ATP phosphoribosyltransferase regulatory subunit
VSTWQLPEGIDELTGDKALVFESIRRQLIDLYVEKGFNLVIPPMVENVESASVMHKNHQLWFVK